MRKLIMAAVALAATGAHAYTKEAVKDAQDYYEHVMDRFNTGELTRSDVEEAHRFLLDMKYYAKEIPKDEYCGLATEAQTVVVVGMEEEARVGQRSTTDVVRAKRSLHELKAHCH